MVGAMTGRKMSFLEFWRSKRERGALVDRASQLRLLPSQLTQLLGHSGVRVALQNSRVASLLPPVGTEVFRRLAPASLKAIQQRHEAEEKERENRKKNKEEVKKDRPKPASDLEAGKPLPFFYGDPPPELLNTPLEELDPYYQSQTFVVLGRGNIIHRFDAEPACDLLSPFNPLRTVATKILIHSLFSFFLMVTILTNCVFMTMSDPPAWSKTVEYVFAAIYTFETILKVVSRGLCVRKFSFLRDPWNWLDVVVVSTAYLSEFVDFGKFSVLRTVPRVLKIIPLIPGLKMTVRAFVQSVKRLTGVIVLMVLCLSISAVIGLHLFMGSLMNKCVIMPPSSNLTFDSGPTPFYYDNETGSSDFNFHKYLNNPVNQYHLPGQLDALLCGNASDAGVCPEGYVCIRGGANPNYGYTNYDSFGWSLLTLFRLMTKNFWENLLMLTLRANGKTFLLFFMLFVFPGSFCLLSLVLVVVSMSCGDQVQVSVAEAKQKDEEFSQILEALRRSEEEERAACGAALTVRQHGEKKRSHEETATEESRGQSSCPPCWFICANLLLKWNCCGCWRWLKQLLYAVVTSPFFDLGVAVCLVLNTVFIAMEHYPMTAEFEMHLSVAHLVFTAIFTAEMVFKLVAMDPYGYFQVGWNIFDSIVVLFSLLELGLADVERLSVLRICRLMRVFRLARFWPSFNVLLKVIWTSVTALRNLTLLLLIMVFIFAVAGMQLFQKDYKDCVCRIALDCELPRWHMADFVHALLIVIRALCGDWIETMWDCMEVSGQTTCLIFFMMVLVIGHLMILNLFLTLLLSPLSCGSLATTDEKEKNNLEIGIEKALAGSWIQEHICALLGRKNHVNPDHMVDTKEENSKEYLALNCVTSDQPVSEALSGHQGKLTSDCRVPSATAEIQIQVKTPENKDEEGKKGDNVQKHPEAHRDKDEEDPKGQRPEDCCSDRCYRCCPFLDIDASQGKGRIWSNFRRACYDIVQHKYFESFIILIIVLSSAALVFEDVHLQQRKVLKMIVETADRVFTCVFLFEMLLKWIGLGLKKYFSCAWCWLDFLILDVSLVSLISNMLGFSGLGAIHSLRALGPLRVLSRFQGLRVVVQVMVRSVLSTFDELLVVLLVCLIFSSMGVTLFAGKFYYCFNETSEAIFLPEDVNNKTECASLIMHNFTEIRWKNLKVNYDSIANGYVALLHLEASASWYDIIYAAVDSREVESQPVYEYNLYNYLYFICLLIGSFFTFNFFIRFIINNLLRDKTGGTNIFMTEEQQRFSRAMKERFSKPPRTPAGRPQNRCRALFFDLVTSPYFEVVKVVLVCLNIVPLMIETYHQSAEKEEILYWLCFFFIIIFFIEFILKIIAFRQHYFKDGWNVLDFVVLASSIIGLFLSDLLEKYFISISVYPLLRLPAIGRILHLIRCAKGIRKLLLAFVTSLPALFNMSLLLLIIMFTFSILGMFNFAYVKEGALIDDMWNFETFGNSLICLFMVSTSSDWGSMLYPMLNTPPDCDPYTEHPGFTVKGDCGYPITAIAFFATCVSLSIFIVLHMYIVVLLETFSSEDTEALSDTDLQMFYKTWRKFDPAASQFIHYSELSDFCDTLQDPLRIPKPNTIRLIHMDLPLFPGDKVHCVDVLLTLATQVLDDAGDVSTLKARFEEKFLTSSSKNSSEPISSTLRRKQEEVAAKVIQRAYRKGLLQHGDTKETVAECVGGASE